MKTSYDSLKSSQKGSMRTLRQEIRNRKASRFLTPPTKKAFPSSSVQHRAKACFKLSMLATAAIMLALSLEAFAQRPDPPIIKNQARATYTDSRGNYHNTHSNTFRITVAIEKVAGLVITPDFFTPDEIRVVAPGMSITLTSFRVKNTGNFTDQIKFLANGKSIRVVGPATVEHVYISSSVRGVSIQEESNSNIDIHTNPTDVFYSLAQGIYVRVRVSLRINTDAAVGSTIQVFLGDATTGTNFDNIAADNSANEVRTVSTGAVNGPREARGSQTLRVVDDSARLTAHLAVPPGPVPLGSTIRYEMRACNNGVVNLTNIWINAPIPVGTRFANTSSLPANTILLRGISPSGSSTVTHVMIDNPSPLLPGACTPVYNLELTITTNNASKPIYAIIDANAHAIVGGGRYNITDHSGDGIHNKGDGRANFDEPVLGEAASPNQGFQLPTALVASLADVLIGPDGAPAAVGPTSNDDDYTNLSVDTGIVGIAPGSLTDAPGTVVFTNTVQNNSNADDTFELSVPTASGGATVEISTDGGTSYTQVGGSRIVNLTVATKSLANIKVRVTLPGNSVVLNGYDIVIRAVSLRNITRRNETINRVYTGFIKLDKKFTGNANAISGDVVTYETTYKNISSTGGVGNAKLVAAELVITEDGSAWRNNWGAITDHIPGSASDTSNGTITGDAIGSDKLTVTVPLLPPGASGTFTFKRKVK